MAKATFEQTNFLGGEWSKSSQGRTDLPDYKKAMNVCLNGYPTDTGLWTRRPGGRFMQTTRGGLPARLITFSFHDATPYTMEFTDGHLRFFNQLTLAGTNDDQAVAAISTANPAKVTTGTHGWTTGDQGYFIGLAPGECSALANRVVSITVTSSTQFTLSDPLTGAAINGAGFATPAAATFRRVVDLVTSYSGTTALKSLRSVQAEKRSVLLNATIKPQLLSVTADATATSFATMSLATAVFKDGPYYDLVAGGALITPSGLTGSITMTVSFPAYAATTVYSKGDFALSSSVNYQSLVDQNLNNTPASSPTFWAPVSAGIAVGPNGFVGSDVGRMIRLFSEPPLWVSATSYAAGNVVAFNGSYWTALGTMTGASPSTGNINPNQPGNLTTTWAINPTGASWNWGKITGFSNQISQTVSGVSNIGDMTFNGGLAASFDSNQFKSYSVSSWQNHSPGSLSTSYIGRHFGGGAQAISSVTVTPSSDRGIVWINFPPSAGDFFILNLRAKATLPSNSADGTLLGTTGHITANTTNSIAIPSNDQVTTWNYVWIEIVNSYLGTGSGFSLENYSSQVQFYSPTGTGSGTGITVELLGGNLKYTTPVRVWRLGLFSDTTGYPTTGTYHEGRLWLSGIIGNRFDASVPNDIFNFAPTESDGTVTDASAISYLLDAEDVNSIFWMQSEQQGVLLGTQPGEWLVQATTVDPTITPLNIKARRVTKNGCANIEPRRTGLTLTFVQKFKRQLMEYFADMISGKFTSPNLSLYAKHLANRGLEEIAYQQELAPIIWSRCADGSLIGATYKRESLFSSQGPSFIGWHRHLLGSGRTVESIATGPSNDGLLDTLTMVTVDPVSTVRHVSCLTNMWQEGSALSSAWYLDDAVIPLVSQNIVFGGQSTMQLTGLGHLEGKVVSVWGGGLDLGDFTVASGQVNVPYVAANPLFNSAYIATFTTFPVVVGFTYTSDGQIVRPDTPQESGSRNGPAFGKKRRVNELAMLLVDTQGLSYGSDFTRLSTCLFNTAGRTPLTANTLFSGLFRDTNKGDETYDEMLCWRVTRPFPVNIASIGGFIDTKDA